MNFSAQQKGIAHILLLALAALGLVIYLLVTSILPFKDKLFGFLYPKPSSQASQPPIKPANNPQKGLIFDGLEVDTQGPCKGLYRLKNDSPALSRVPCSHGPDPAPEGVVIGQTTTEPLASNLITAAFQCDGDGTSGKRVEVIYARASDQADRYSTYLSSIQQWAGGVDNNIQTSATQTGGTRHLRFVQDTNCNPLVRNVVLSTTGDDNFSNTTSELKAQGYNRSDRKYLVFVDANIYCGIAGLYIDDQPGSTNANNSGPLYARIDNGCWAIGAAAHELTHTLGAVQPSAPHKTPYTHCWDEYDVMCYKDGADSPSIQYLCSNQANDELLDCNHDDYFHTNPPTGNYLATHWNLANSQFLVSANSTTPTPTLPSGSGGNGLQGTYFDNMDFTGASFSRTDASINFNWGQATPDPRIGSETFSVRWTGQIQPQFSQNYTFYTLSDDGVRLWVNNQLVIDNWTDHSLTENSGSISLTAGQKYFIKMEFYDNCCDATAQLFWSSSSTPKQIIPQSQLFSNLSSNSDTTSPSVAITSPVNGSTVSKGSYVIINADASDNIGVTKVEFYVNGGLKCTDTTSAYSCSWKVSGKPNAAHTLSVKAYDRAGNTSSSSITTYSR